MDLMAIYQNPSGFQLRELFGVTLNPRSPDFLKFLDSNMSGGLFIQLHKVVVVVVVVVVACCLLLVGCWLLVVGCGCCCCCCCCCCCLLLVVCEIQGLVISSKIAKKVGFEELKGEDAMRLSDTNIYKCSQSPGMNGIRWNYPRLTCLDVDCLLDTFVNTAPVWLFQKIELKASLASFCFHLFVWFYYSEKMYIYILLKHLKTNMTLKYKHLHYQRLFGPFVHPTRHMTFENKSRI